jgi:hypothetical protein
MDLKVTRLEHNIRPKDREEIRVKTMGNIIELMHTDISNNKIFIRKISDTEYIDLRTGEVKECARIENRAGNLNSIRQSLGRLRDLLNTNITDVRKCKWVTLTYAENMTDPKQLYNDFKKFNMRLKHLLSKDGYSYEYIVCMEPQGRGAWHAHLVMIFDTQAPYIDNEIMAKTWRHGFTVTKKLDNVDNVGAYLTAYLGDMEVSEFHSLSVEEQNSVKVYGIKEVEVGDVKKSIIKGGRLHMYPPKFNLYRCSKGVKKPVITYEIEEDARKKASAGTLTFEKTLELTNVDCQFKKHINYRYYNLKATSKS